MTRTHEPIWTQSRTRPSRATLGHRGGPGLGPRGHRGRHHRAVRSAHRPRVGAHRVRDRRRRGGLGSQRSGNRQGHQWPWRPDRGPGRTSRGRGRRCLPTRQRPGVRRHGRPGHPPARGRGLVPHRACRPRTHPERAVPTGPGRPGQRDGRQPRPRDDRAAMGHRPGVGMEQHSPRATGVPGPCTGPPPQEPRGSRPDQRPGAPHPSHRRRGDHRAGLRRPAKARDVLVATHSPIHDPDGHALRARSLRHYAIAVPVDGPPPGTTYGVDDRSMSTRPVVLPDGRPGAVVVGAKMRTGQIPDADPWADLARQAHAGFGAGPPAFTWATQDLSTPDLLPYVGRTRREPHVLIATGFGGWGFTNAAAVAATLPAILDTDADRTPRPPARPTHRRCPGSTPALAPRRGHRHPDRRRLGRGQPHRGHPARHRPPIQPPHRPRPGPGRRRTPAPQSRQQDPRRHRSRGVRPLHPPGMPRALEPWEQSWDCPCHGSRFAPDGTSFTAPHHNPSPTKPPHPTTPEPQPRRPIARVHRTREQL